MPGAPRWEFEQGSFPADWYQDAQAGGVSEAGVIGGASDEMGALEYSAPRVGESACCGSCASGGSCEGCECEEQEFGAAGRCGGGAVESGWLAVHTRSWARESWSGAFQESGANPGPAFGGASLGANSGSCPTWYKLPRTIHQGRCYDIIHRQTGEVIRWGCKNTCGPGGQCPRYWDIGRTCVNTNTFQLEVASNKTVEFTKCIGEVCWIHYHYTSICDRYCQYAKIGGRGGRGGRGDQSLPPQPGGGRGGQSLPPQPGKGRGGQSLPPQPGKGQKGWLSDGAQVDCECYIKRIVDSFWSCHIYYYSDDPDGGTIDRIVGNDLAACLGEMRKEGCLQEDLCLSIEPPECSQYSIADGRPGVLVWTNPIPEIVRTSQDPKTGVWLAEVNFDYRCDMTCCWYAD